MSKKKVNKDKNHKQKIKEYDVREPKNKLSIKENLLKLKETSNADESFFVHMELRNGHHTHFIVFTNSEYFEYNGGTYIIDDGLKYYDLEAKMYCLDYHQSISLPIKRKVDISGLKDAFDVSGANIRTASNPKTLKAFIESEVVERVIKSDELIKEMKFIKMLCLLSAVGVVLTLLIVVKTTGVIDSINLGF